MSYEIIAESNEKPVFKNKNFSIAESKIPVAQ